MYGYLSDAGFMPPSEIQEKHEDMVIIANKPFEGLADLTHSWRGEAICSRRLVLSAL
jgi:hypothetical protein